jgi:sugar/nucleoside kinase (ribokinase family)
MRLLGVGDNVVDRYRQLGLMFPGGQALNVAVAARRAGAEAGYLGALGTDGAGRHVLAALIAEGVDVERVRIVAGANGYADVELTDGDRVFVGSSLGVSRFGLTIEDLAYAASFDIAHSSESSGLESDIPRLAALVAVSFDFATQRQPAYLQALLPHLTVACFSASDLDDEAAEAFLRRAVEQGPKLALATRGTADAILVEGRRVLRQPAVSVEVVDTLGAGDAFTGRFLVGVINGEDRAATLSAAAHAAARTCASYGAFGYGTPIVPAGEEEASHTIVPMDAPSDQRMTVVERP